MPTDGIATDAELVRLARLYVQVGVLPPRGLPWLVRELLRQLAAAQRRADLLGREGARLLGHVPAGAEGD